MKIVKAEKAMLAEIIAIENEAFTCPWSAKSFDEAFESPNITVYAALGDDGCVIGFSCIMCLDTESEILNIAVSERERQRGVGGMLLNAMITDASGDGVTDFYLEVRESNHAAKCLYEKNGFIPLGIRRKYYVNPTEDAIVMLKNIENPPEGVQHR